MSTSANRNNAVLSECTAAGDQCHRERQTRGGESLPRHATDALDEENEEGYESFSPVDAGGRSSCLTLQASALAPSERYTYTACRRPGDTRLLAVGNVVVDTWIRSCRSPLRSLHSPSSINIRASAIPVSGNGSWAPLRHAPA